MNEIYHGRIPNRDNEPNPILVDKVAELLNDKFGKSIIVAPDTILRAAGRRKDARGPSHHG